MPSLVRLDNGVAEPFQALAGQDVGQAVEPVVERGPLLDWLAKVAEVDLARSVGQRLIPKR